MKYTSMAYYSSNNSTLIHRWVRTKSGRDWRRRRNSLRHDAPNTDVILQQEDNDTNRKAYRKQSWFPKRISRLSTRLLSIAVVIQALVVTWNRHCRDCHNLQLFSEDAHASPHQPYPITVQAMASHDFTRVIQLSRHNKPLHWIQNRENRYWLDGNPNRPKYDPVSLIPETCQGEAWMTDLHPSCLNIHDIDMTDFFFNSRRDFVYINERKRRKKMKFIGEGGFRNAIMFHEEFSGKRRVLKTLIYDEANRDFNPRTFDKMRRDAVISEQLTASPYIADIYGHCGTSSVMDYSNDKTLDYIYEQHPSKDELFEIAHDVAQSIADAHHVNATHGRATIVHMDIKPDQWIYLNGRYKLNDFNLARMLTWNPVKQENCHAASGYSGSRYQAPEQYTEEFPLSEKIDVWSLGNIFGFLLTNESPFESLSSDSAEEEIEAGEIWNIEDPKVLNSTHPFDVTLLQAMKRCLKLEPSERPSAQEVADFVRSALDKYIKSKRGSD